MGVPTSEVGYTIATNRRETTKVLKNMWWQWGGILLFLEDMNFLITPFILNFLVPPFPPSTGPNIFLNTLTSKAHNFCSQLKVADYLSLTYQRAGKIIFYHHHHEHQVSDPLFRSVSKVTTALSNVSSVFQLFSFHVVCSSMISKGFGFVALYLM